jgi:tetratricopeptide (TPR) repeat protein
LLGRISEALLAFDREKTLQVAQKYIDKRKYDRAIVEYQKVVEHEPNDARTLLRIGDLQARLGTHAEAIATYDRVALYYAGRGFSLKAVAVLKQISELIDRHAPQLADQYGHVAPKLAQIYADLGLINDALATYDAVARRLQNRGRDRDAVEIIRRMVALERSNPLPYLRLAEALCRVSRVDEAVEHFWGASQLLTQQNRPDDALKVLERILHFRQDVRVARVAAELYLTKNNRDAGLSALSRLQLCFEADPRDLETLGLLAQAFDVIGQPAKGVEVYKEMARIASETGQEELYQRYVQHLLAVAPRDEHVRALATHSGRPLEGRALERSPTQSRSSSPPESLTEDDIEFIDDEPSLSAHPTRSEGDSSLSAPNASAPDAATAELVRQALGEAESLRARKQFSKAAAALRRALGPAPRSLELRAALQQVLLEMGDRAGAIDQMLAVAQHYADRNSLSAAEAELYQVLELSPENPAALALLAQLEAKGRRRAPPPARSAPKALKPSPGRRADEASSPNGEHEAFELVASRVSTPAAPAELSDETEEMPLPAYELEDDDLVTVSPGPVARVAPVAPSVEPAPPEAAASDAPLPQFSLDSGLHLAPEAGAARSSGGERPGREQRSEPVASPRISPTARESIRAALDEAQFFSSRGLYQDASMILRDRLEQYPEDRELSEALAELAPKLESESGMRDVARASIEAPPTSEAPATPQAAAPVAAHGFDDEEETMVAPTPRDLDAQIAQGRAAQAAQGAAAQAAPPGSSKLAAKELVVQFSTDGTTQAGPIIDADADGDLMQSLEEPKQQQIDVDEVFAKFKQGVKAQVSDSDSATHYDLGVAYKEMGLLADATREFEIASRDPKRECNCLAMMGMMYRERGDLDRAAEAYVRGLSAQHKTVAQEISLYYDLGVVYEMKNDPDEAIYYFQRITRRDPSYRDVAQRLTALLPRSRRFSQPARAINDDQDFDRSFDDMYKPE